MRVKAQTGYLCEGGVVILTQSPSSGPAVQTWQPLRWSALLPREHGSWALVFEPLLLALVVAPTWRGAGVALAAVMLFLARRPYQMVASGVGGAQARGVLAALVSLAILLGAVAIGAAAGGVAVPLAAGLFATGVFAWFERRRDGRAALAECAGAATFAAVAIVIVLLAAEVDGAAAALAVGGFAIARSWTSILPVRVYVRRRKGQAASARAAWVIAGLACVGACASVVRLGSWVPVAWTMVFAARTAWLVGPWAPCWPARRIGWMEATIGLVACVTTAISLS